jgi:ParB family chromosome partitioning protein
MHHDALKHQGRRTDMIQEIERLLDKDFGELCDTSDAIQQRYNAREKTANDYGLDANAVAQYLRVNKLIKPLLVRLDNDEMAMRAAVSVSHLTNDEQVLLEKVLEADQSRIDMKKAVELRNHSKAGTLDETVIRLVLNGETKKSKTQNSIPHFKIPPTILKKYFSPDDSTETIEEEISLALEMYFKAKGNL